MNQDGLTVQTSDDVFFVVPPELCAYSALLQSLHEDRDEDVPLFGVTNDVMTRILHFIRVYHTTPFVLVKPLPPSQYEKHVPSEHKLYMKQFIDASGKPMPVFYDTLQAANYLGVETLVALMCAYLAQILSCKSHDQIKTLLAYFGLVV